MSARNAKCNYLHSSSYRFLPKLAVIASKSLGFLFRGRPFCRGVVGAPLKNGTLLGLISALLVATGGIDDAWWWWWNSGLGNGGAKCWGTVVAPWFCVRWNLDAWGSSANAISKCCRHKTSPSRIPKWSPFVRGAEHSAQEKQCTWKTESRARITSSDESIVAWHLPQRFIPNNLQQKYSKFNKIVMQAWKFSNCS